MCKILVEGLENPDLDPESVEEFATQVMQLQNEQLSAAQGLKPVELWLTSVEHHTYDEIHSVTRQHMAKLSVLTRQKKRVRMEFASLSSPDYIIHILRLKMDHLVSYAVYFASQTNIQANQLLGC